MGCLLFVFYVHRRHHNPTPRVWCLFCSENTHATSGCLYKMHITWLMGWRFPTYCKRGIYAAQSIHEWAMKDERTTDSHRSKHATISSGGGQYAQDKAQCVWPWLSFYRSIQSEYRRNTYLQAARTPCTSETLLPLDMLLKHPRKHNLSQFLNQQYKKKC